MNSAPITPSGGGPGNVSGYKFEDGENMKDVHPSKMEVADKIDINPKNGVCSEDEIKDYMRKHDILRDPTKAHVDEEKLVTEFKEYLENKPIAQAMAYPTYEAMMKELQDLAAKNPNLCKLESAGKSFEGRDIPLFKLTEGAQGDTSDKPGILITGLTHAREHIGLMVPLYSIRTLIQGFNSGDPKIKERLKNGELWFMPMVNPDGYEKSRNGDRWWRKNTRPVVEPQLEWNVSGEKETKPRGIGVDLNRNFHDGNPDHFEMWRPKGDTPESTYDDFSATSDDPNDDTYRGPSGASESETKAVINVDLGKKNIKGVIDFHSYGEMILYPWGHTTEPPENVELYKELGSKMNSAMGNKYSVMQSSDLYPCSGTSDNLHQANKRLNYTIELARSFAPYEKDIEPTCKTVHPGVMTFIDYVIEHKDEIPWPDQQPKKQA